MLVALILFCSGETIAGEKTDDSGVSKEFDAFKLLDSAPKTRRELPRGKKIVRDGVEYQAYTARELAEIIKLEDDYVWLHKRFFPLVHAHAQGNLELKALSDRKLLCDGSKEMLIKDRLYYKERLDESKDYALRLSKSAKRERVLLIGAVLVEVVVIGALGFKVVAD